MVVDRVENILMEVAAGGILFTGAQAYVSLGGEVVLDVSLGQTPDGREMFPTTIHRVYCATKPVVAVGVWCLAADGLIDLSSPIGNQIAVRDKKLRSVTANELLSHRTGFPAGQPAVGAVSDEYLREALLAAPARPDWVHGGPPIYSLFANWYVLGLIAASAADVDICRYSESVLRAAGINDIWLRMTSEEHQELSERLALNASSDTGRLVPLRYELVSTLCTCYNPANNGFATARALGAFYEASLVESSIIGEATRDLALPFGPLGFDPVMRRICRYGRGFMVELSERHGFGSYVSPTAYGHSAGDGGSFAFADPEYELVVVVLPNGFGSWETSVQLRARIIDTVYRQLGLAR